MVDKLRIDYENQHRIQYKWVIRMRYDMLLRTNVWDSLFKITPNKVNSERFTSKSFIRNEFFYEFLHDPSDKVMFIPDCDHWSGLNDQFGFASSKTFTEVYSDRSRFDVLRSLYSSSKELKFHFHSETTLRCRSEQLNLTVIKIPLCYSNIRLFSRQANCSFVKPSAGTIKGFQCCQKVCSSFQNQIDLRKDEFKNINSPDDYLKQFHVESNKTNFYYFYMSKGDVQSSICFPNDWNKTNHWDPYKTNVLPFIRTTNETKKIINYLRLSSCQNRNQ